MNPEKTHLYKKQYQQPVEEETPPKKRKSKTAATSDSRKRSKHKHIYKKIILHYGSDSFSWGGQCEICGRLDSTYKSSNWNPEELQVTGEGLYGEWRSICLKAVFNPGYLLHLHHLLENTHEFPRLLRWSLSYRLLAYEAYLRRLILLHPQGFVGFVGS